MAYDESKRAPADGGRINFHMHYRRRFWPGKSGASPEELEKAGHQRFDAIVEDVEDALSLRKSR